MTPSAGVLRSVQIESHDVFQLFGKARIVGNFEGAHEVELQFMRLSDAPDRATAQVQGLGQRPPAPD